MEKGKETNLDQQLFIFILSLATPLVLYFNRSLDNNRLTSWAWVFHSASVSGIVLVLVAALVVAWLLSLFSFYEKRTPLFLFGAAFVMASCFWSEPEVIVDSSRYFTQAKQLDVYGIGYFARQWGKAVFAWTDLPLVPFLYGLVFKFFGEQRIFIQVLNTFFYSLTVVLTWQLGKTLWDEDTGFRGGLLLLGFPYLFVQVPLMLVDVPTMFFFMLAVVASVKAFKDGGAGRIFLAALAIFLVFYAKYSTWLLLTVIPVVFVYYLYRNPGATLKRGWVLALSALVMIGIFFLVYENILVPQLDFLMEYQKPGLNSWGESYISTFLFQIHPFITAAAVFAVFAAMRKRDAGFIVVSFLILLFLLMQVKRIRYTLPVFPMLALMAAYGIGEIRHGRLLRQVIFSIVATSFVVALWGFLPFLKTLGVGNLQTAGHYLNDIPGTTVEVLSRVGEDAVVNPATSIPILDIYTDKRLVYEYEPAGPEVLERVKTAPLRFTWEMPLPRYYFHEPGTEKFDALVVISDDPGWTPDPGDEKIFSEYPFHKSFKQSSNIFQHQTFVTVYHK